MSVRSQVVKSRNSESSNPSRCSYATSDNRRCTMLRHATHPSLCLFHAREERHLIEADRIGPELASISGDFRTVTDINHALAKLWELLSHDRISRKRAGTLAFIAALLLPTVSKVTHESNLARGYDAWKEDLARAFPPRNPTSGN